MALQLSYFAWVRDRMGLAEEVIAPDSAIATVGDLLIWLRDRDECGAAAFAESSRIRAAIDGTMASLDSSLSGAREVALFPPVTGG